MYKKKDEEVSEKIKRKWHKERGKRKNKLTRKKSE